MNINRQMLKDFGWVVLFLVTVLLVYGLGYHIGVSCQGGY